MLIAIISLYRERFQVGRVKLLTCQKCNATRAHYDLLDYTIEWREKWEGGLLLQEGKTQSGAHFCEKLSRGGWIPSYQGDMRFGKFYFIPEEGQLGNQFSVGRFTADSPFKHVLHIVVDGESYLEIERTSEAECPTCFRNRLRESPLRQGHLFLAKVEKNQMQRLSGYEDEVQVYTGSEKEAEFELFNHQFAVNHGSIMFRNNYGTIELQADGGYLTISSEDHPDQPITFTGPGVWDFYHPWPRLDVD